MTEQTQQNEDPRSALPQVDHLVNRIAPDNGTPRAVLVDVARKVIKTARKRIRRTNVVPGEDELIAQCRDELSRRAAKRLRPVINATGVLLHTNLGRAPLSEKAIEAVTSVARSYSNLEYDTDAGKRGDRYEHVEPLVALATGAEAALVVNNNAAAVLLVCAALGRDKDVVISRGELIEIGGEFRIPEILEMSGARLKEVGTTNRTHLRDYGRAINDDTAFILKVHPSNYRVVGFTAAPEVPDLASLAKKRKVPLVYDVGSGLLSRSFADEPVVSDVIAKGADLVCFSGDKLLGGPQAGVVCGKADLVDRLRSHPLVRAMRPDKMQLAALGATIESYLDGTASDLPLWRSIDATPASITRRARRVANILKAAGYIVTVAGGESVTGGGSVPGHAIPTTVVRVRHPVLSADDLAASLRRANPPVVGRTEGGDVVLDLRTVPPKEDVLVRDALLYLT